MVNFLDALSKEGNRIIGNAIQETKETAKSLLDANVKDKGKDDYFKQLEQKINSTDSTLEEKEKALNILNSLHGLTDRAETSIDAHGNEVVTSSEVNEFIEKVNEALPEGQKIDACLMENGKTKCE